MPDEPANVSEHAREQKADRESSIEDVLADVRDDLGRRSYPTTSEDLAATYADEPTDLPNETESLGSAFDWIDDQFGDADEAFAAFLAEFERGAYAEGCADATQTDNEQWSEERVDDDRPPAEENTEGQQERARERAQRAQASEAESSESSGGSG
jgi:hypothetical protein